MKKLFHTGFILLLLSAATVASYQLAYAEMAVWLFLLLMSLAPLLQFLFRWDRQPSMSSKLRQPLVSLAVLLGMALLLLTVPAPGLALWLGLAVVGGYLLDTYWDDSTATAG